MRVVDQEHVAHEAVSTGTGWQVLCDVVERILNPLSNPCLETWRADAAYESYPTCLRCVGIRVQGR